MRSNLEYEYCHCSLSLTNNPYFTISNNIIDANSFIITQNAKEHAISNYIQEVKNYIDTTGSKFPYVEISSETGSIGESSYSKINITMISLILCLKIIFLSIQC